jgi:hypothetical protein
MSLVVPKDIAVAAGNLVRGTALSQYPSWRPIAYGFESSASVLSVDGVKETPVDVHQAFSSLSFEHSPAEIGDLVTEVYEVDGSFDSSNLREVSNFRIDGSVRLLTTLRKMSLKVFYLFSIGKREEMDNKTLLPTTGNIVVFSSRHTRLENISFQQTLRPDGSVLLEFKCSDSNAIVAACHRLSEIFSSVKE